MATQLNEIKGSDSENARGRSSSIKAIVLEAPEIGIDKAIEKFGKTLNDSDKNMLKSLGPDELRSLKSAVSKLGSSVLRADNNNNNM